MNYYNGVAILVKHLDSQLIVDTQRHYLNRQSLSTSCLNSQKQVSHENNYDPARESFGGNYVFGQRKTISLH